MRDYKDIWIDAYEEAKDRGLTDEQAALVADEKVADFYAYLCDAAKDARKEQSWQQG